MKRTLLLLLAIVGLVSGHSVTCDAQSQGSHEDEEAIKEVIAGTTDAFNRHDAKAFASCYTPDAELVTVRGERMKGAAEIEKGLAAIFATRAKAVTLRTLDTTVRFIRPDVAVAHVTNELGGLVSPEGEQLPAHRELSIRVLVKERGRWLVTAFHNTIVRPFEHPAHVQERRQPVIQHIDHIMIRTDKPDELYAFFVDTLQLPVAWPLAERGGVTSGGVGFGNVNVEAIKFPGQSGEPRPTHLVGFAFKPVALDESLAELRRRGIAYGEPRPFVSTGPDGTRTVSFTNVTLSQLSDADRPASAILHVFLSEYNPAYVDVGQRRARLRRELAARAGGPLGVLGVEEIVVGTTDLDAANRLYEKLLEPEARVSGAWRIGDGPRIRLVRAEEDLVQRLVISVVSLERARGFLEGRELLGSVSERQVTIAPSKIHGLSIVLIDVGIEGDETRSK